MTSVPTNLVGGLVRWDPPVEAASVLVPAIPGHDHEMEPRRLTAGPASFVAVGPTPVLARSGALVVVADAELTNLEELSAALGSSEPASLVAALYADEGAAGLRRLRGGFCLALWDPGRDELVLAVDHVGIKRLYYASADSGRGLAFASRSEPLLAAPGLRGSVDPAAVYHYLNFGFVPAPHSVFAGLRRLPPGHVLVWRGATSAPPSPYWDLRYEERPLPLREACARTFRHLEQAVARSIDQVHPKDIGAFLSGGTDSSTVLGLMSRLTGERIKAFSIGFQEQRYDELHYARLAARHFNADHHVAVVTADDALAAVPALVAARDEPFGNASLIPTYLCARLAAQAGVHRLLAGDGGDELFGGNERYQRYQIFAAYHRIPASLRRGLLEPILFRLPDVGPIGRAQRYVRKTQTPVYRWLFFWSFFAAREASTLLAPEFLSAVDAAAPWSLARAYDDRAVAASGLNRLLYLDMKFTIGDNDLVKVTAACDLAGVAVRFPILDPPLVDFTATLPGQLKVKGLQKRFLFKRTFRQLLPKEILAKQKHGFGLPIGVWLRSHAGFRELGRDALLAPDARSRPYFRPGALEELFDLHDREPTPYYGDQLWKFLMFELWYRAHVRTN